MVGSSPLVKFPEHVHAIGMLTIEMGNLEVMFVQLLGTILRVPESMAAAILVTPRSTRSRLDIVVNVSAEVLSEKNLESVKGLVKRAIAILGKRNDIVHDFWAVSTDRTEVMQIPAPYGKPKPIRLGDLNLDIERLRRLADDVLEFRVRLYREMQMSPHYEVDIAYKISP
jgi:hypothetical protein